MMLNDMKCLVAGIASALRAAATTSIDYLAVRASMRQTTCLGALERNCAKMAAKMAAKMVSPISTSWHDPVTDDVTTMPDHLITNHSFNARKAAVAARQFGAHQYRALKQQYFHLAAAQTRREPGTRQSGRLPEGQVLSLFKRNGSSLVQTKLRMEV